MTRLPAQDLDCRYGRWPVNEEVWFWHTGQVSPSEGGLPGDRLNPLHDPSGARPLQWLWLGGFLREGFSPFVLIPTNTLSNDIDLGYSRFATDAGRLFDISLLVRLRGRLPSRKTATSPS